ncbi:MAG: hypothetical protein HC819_19590 [Cyclobacteriaceae bacterium]|nr:hypothetical protein [Cyclobacteriaceae bacterium]
MKKNKIKRQNPCYAEAKSVLMFFTSEGNQKIALVKGLQNKMEKEGKNVTCLFLVMRDEDKPDVHMDEGMERLVPDDFSMFGSVEKPLVKKIINEGYDFLIHADMQATIYTDLIMAQCHAKCRIGRYFEGRESQYDLMVGIADDKKISFLLDQLYFYTKAL